MPKKELTLKDMIVCVYCEGPADRWYIRLVPTSTPKFSHGLALATSFKTKKEAEEFKELVWEYIETGFNIKPKDYGF